MFKEEAEVLNKVLEKIPLKKGDFVLDIGSSSLNFRTIVQPHIDEKIFKPLRDLGCNVNHLDQKEEIGIDLVINLIKPGFVWNSKQHYDLILCTNILEHVTDRNVFIKNLLQFAKLNSYILFTVPYIYFKHNDPIDTMFRPSPSELVSWLRPLVEFIQIESGRIIITDKKYYKRYKRLHRFLPIKIPIDLWRYCFSFHRWEVTFLLIKIS